MSTAASIETAIIVETLQLMEVCLVARLNRERIVFDDE